GLMKPASILFLAFICAELVIAQNNPISWVASTGNDANFCTHASPCRTFQRAHDQAPSGSIIKAIDTENYLPVIITKSITIDGTGSGAFIDTNVDGITISSSPGNPPPGQVNILGLTIHGFHVSTAYMGITTCVSSIIHVENVVITGN